MSQNVSPSPSANKTINDYLSMPLTKIREITSKKAPTLKDAAVAKLWSVALLIASIVHFFKVGGPAIYASGKETLAHKKVTPFTTEAKKDFKELVFVQFGIAVGSFFSPSLTAAKNWDEKVVNYFTPKPIDGAEG